MCCRTLLFFLAVVWCWALCTAINILSTSNGSPDLHPPSFRPDQCRLERPGTNDWSDLRPQPGPLPDPNTLFFQQNSSAQQLEITISSPPPMVTDVTAIPQRGCLQLRHYVFRNAQGVIRTRPVRFNRPDNDYWFAFGADGLTVVTAWVRGPEATGWHRHTFTGPAGRMRGGLTMRGNFQVMFDVDLEPKEGGVSGEIALFWTNTYRPRGTSTTTSTTSTASVEVIAAS